MVQIHIKGVTIEFPFTPYDCQVSYMEKVIQCLQEVRCIFRVYLGVRESSFNMTRGGDEDIETRSLKF